MSTTKDRRLGQRLCFTFGDSPVQRTGTVISFYDATAIIYVDERDTKVFESGCKNVTTLPPLAPSWQAMREVLQLEVDMDRLPVESCWEKWSARVPATLDITGQWCSLLKLRNDLRCNAIALAREDAGE